MTHRENITFRFRSLDSSTTAKVTATSDLAVESYTTRGGVATQLSLKGFYTFLRKWSYRNRLHVSWRSSRYRAHTVGTVS